MINPFKFVWRHKIYTLLIIAALAGGGYWGYQKWFGSQPTIKYVTTKVTRGALTTVVSGTGQVSALSQVDIKPKTSGNIIYVNAKVGQEVKLGAILVSLDASDALKTVRDAESNLESSKLSLEKLLQPTDELTIMQADNALISAKESKQTAEENIVSAYESAYNAVAAAFLDLPTIISDLNNVLYSNNIAKSEISNTADYGNGNFLMGYFDFQDRDKYQPLLTKSENDYKAARAKYDINLEHYKSVNRLSEQAVLDSLLKETLETVKAMAQAAKSENIFLDTWADYRSKGNQTIFATVKTYQTNLSSYISKTNSHVSSLSNIQETIEDNRQSIVSADRTIAEKIISLAKLKEGADPLDVQAQQLSIKQKENAVLDAKIKLADYSVRAPFAGVLAIFTAKKGDVASSGSSLGTLITKQRIATISLNEVDVAKVKVGQKATITFDAIEDLSITGEVVEVDALGTTSQGVVSYNVKIAFDIQDDRVKPGMSVSVNIILSTKPDVLMVSSSAIKTKNGESYVEVLVNASPNGAPSGPEQKTIAVGDSNDTMTEIVSGLIEGDDVVIQTVSSASVSSAMQTGSQTNNRNAGGPAGGNFMMLR